MLPGDLLELTCPQELTRLPIRAHCTLVILILTLLPAVGSGKGETLGHPGYLIITAGRDSSAGYTWLEGPGPHQISMTWLDGMLTVPDSLPLEPFAERDLAIPVSALFSGAGASGKLEWKDGIFEISEPLMATDGAVQLLASGGELEIVGSRVRYRPPPARDQEKPSDPRASFVMLAGILLLIGVLMRRARKKIKESST